MSFVLVKDRSKRSYEIVKMGKTGESFFLAKKRWLKKSIAKMRVWVCS